ncbi:MAG: biotin--[acetyl-CoA-carboxylase] ligase [Acidimicrobiia bacterium]
MATPYFQLRFDSVASTQDVARETLSSGEWGRVPVVVIAARQTEGRGRGGAHWQTADRALAVSLALRTEDDQRPISLMAGVAVTRLGLDVELKWPNDVMLGDCKVGGILVEKIGDLVVVGLGLNLWWPDAPDGVCALHRDDPGERRHVELGALWGAETMRLLEATGWPRDEYKSLCSTLGREVTWEPNGTGRAVDVDKHGALLVEVAGGTVAVTSGVVRHLRPRSS